MTAIYTYWISTAFLCLPFFISAFLYLSKSDWVRLEIAKLGYPAYLVPFLIIVKIAAPVAVLSRFNVALSELAYAGMFYHLVLAALAHVGARKPKGALPAFIGLLLLSASFLTQNAARDVPAAYAPTAPAVLSTFK
ncbi:hypothetical protein FXN63_11535 [Pigmentiphaga aceris]|uniref:DoxX family protein n=1 Tax=Pigmentiphaga aceris TaxID=1940612 RepID=A0A5C0AY89_9BURK|nr:DoxX family protein [Pigmentiphaga aceris]QEI06393.1 hypothetical protein FXN63_11535 [Pigmentiphaga aceris]